MGAARRAILPASWVLSLAHFALSGQTHVIDRTDLAHDHLPPNGPHSTFR